MIVGCGLDGDLKMRKRYLVVLAVVLLSLVSISLFMFYDFSASGDSTVPKVYVGLEIGLSSVTGVESRIEQVSKYTNLVVIGSTDITSNQTALWQVCQYAYDKGMYFIVYTTTAYSTGGSSLKFAYDAKVAWGNKFLGFYAGDEAGGKQLDSAKTYSVESNSPLFSSEPSNYSEAETQFVSSTNASLNSVSLGADIPLFTSDYALYWFDYLAGYDAVFTEFGWNNSRQIDIALCRGAADVQGKEWGAIITWTYTQWPYIESSAQLTSDMKLAFVNGAKYIVLFDCDGQGGSILNSSQLDALQQFWQYTKANVEGKDSVNSRVAYVLPNAYGYGFRGLNDTIWGVWPADNFTDQLYSNVTYAVQQYGNKLDIVYDDPSFSNYNSMYSTLIFWNGTTASSRNG